MFVETRIANYDFNHFYLKHQINFDIKLLPNNLKLLNESISLRLLSIISIHDFPYNKRTVKSKKKMKYTLRDIAQLKVTKTYLYI